MPNPSNKEVKKYLQILDKPQDVWDTREQGNRTLRFFQEAMFISVPASTQRFLSRLQKQGTKFSPYMAIHNSIGYFTVSAM
jgi:hypothetical protein